MKRLVVSTGWLMYSVAFFAWPVLTSQVAVVVMSARDWIVSR